MKVTGQAVLHAPIEQVWAALNDPEVLVRTIPGCQRLELIGADQYAMTVSAGVASIKGTYAGEVALSDQQQPSSFLLKARGAGAPGTVSADVRVHLSVAPEGTRLDYDAEAVVGGVVGGVGQRMLAGVAKKMAGEFFRAVDDVLTGATPKPVAPKPVAPKQADLTGGQLPTVGEQAGVFVAPARERSDGIPDKAFVVGVVLGAAVALLGFVVGSWRRPR
jgi:uncharacterized protein